MVVLRVKLGPKGQVLIPKMFRDEFELIPGRDIILKEQEDGVLIQRPRRDPIEIFKEVARMPRKKIPFDVHESEEQYEAKARSSRIRL